MGQGDLQLSLTVAFTMAALGGTFVGERFSRRAPAEKLIRMFANFVMTIAAFLIVTNYRALLEF